MNNWGVKALSYTLLGYNWSITWVLKILESLVFKEG